MTPVISVLIALVSAFALTTLVVHVVRRVARGGGLYEQPVEDRWHRRPVPKFGGVAMAIAFFPIAWMASSGPGVHALLIASAFMFALGVFDDLRPVRPAIKFAGQFLAAGLFILLAPPTDITGEPIVDIFLSALWMVGITNAFNLLDNIDGLASGIAAIAGGFFVIALILNGSAPLDALALLVGTMTGVALGFLLYNWHPASIFMGDGGSHLLGAFFAGSTLLAVPHMHEGSEAGVTIAVILLLVPCADTALVILTRQLAGRSAFVGGRDHISHRIVALGMRERPAVLVLYGIAIAGGLVALGLQNLSSALGWAIAALYGVAVAAIGVYLGHVDVAHNLEAPARPVPLLTDLTWRFRGYEVLFDAVLIALAYYLGLVTRFHDSANFALFMGHFTRILPLVVILQLGGLWLAGKYRRQSRSSGLAEALTILRGAAIGSAASVVAVLFLTRFEGYSRQAFAVAAAFVVILLSSGHLAMRAVDEFLRRRRSAGPLAIVYGAGRRGALAVRELSDNPGLGLSPLGVIDDDPARAQDRVEGVRVIGTLDTLDVLLATHTPHLTTVIVSINGLAPAKFNVLCAICAQHRVEVRLLRFGLEGVALGQRGRASGVIRFPRA